MLKCGREVLGMLAVAAIGACALSASVADARAQAPAAARCTLTLELEWTGGEAGAQVAGPPIEAPTQDVLLEVADGRVVEVVGWPWDTAGEDDPAPRAEGSWHLGSKADGKVRARIEADPGSVLVVRRGDHAVRLPIAAILEGPQSAPAAAGLSLTARRLPWDVLGIDFGAGAEDGVAAPGTPVPVTIGYNILQADAAEVTVRTTAALRPAGEAGAVWEFEQREVLPANQPVPPARLWSIPAPAKEGTYVLEVQAAWEATPAREGTRLGRLIRRRRPPGMVGTSSRRVALTVLAPQEGPARPLPAAGDAGPSGVEVDSFDLGRIRNARFSAWGRAPATPGGSAWEIPAQLLADPARREKEREWLRGFIAKAGAEPARIGKADDAGLAWSAVAVRCNRPGRPHRLLVSPTAGEAGAIGAVLVDPGTADRPPRVVLDACGGSSPAGKGPLEWLVWPGSAESILVLVNRSRDADATIGSVRLVEIAPGDEATPVLASSASGRALGIHLHGADALDRFTVAAEPGVDDPLASAENLASYLATCGATFVVLPEVASEREARRRLNGRLAEDGTGPDRMAMALRVLRRRGLSAWLEPDLGRPGALAGLPPAGSEEATAQGVARIGPDGAGHGAWACGRGWTCGSTRARRRSGSRRRWGARSDEPVVEGPEGAGRPCDRLVRLSGRAEPDRQ